MFIVQNYTTLFYLNRKGFQENEREHSKRNKETRYDYRT